MKLFSKTQTLLVCYVYHPPSSRMSWFDDFSVQLDRAAKQKCDTILLGDFNIDLMNQKYNNDRNKWLDTVQMYNFTQLIQECTHITNNSKSLIDHIYVNNEQHVKEINVQKWQ